MKSFWTTVGCAPERILIQYDEDDGLVFGMTVTWNEPEVSGLLTDDTLADLDMECYDNERKLEAIEIANFNYDRGEELYRDRMEQMEAA